ncbi:unnamed protein product [Allacma fusca]|uniref:Uncharacterized protein n=1 Tax=Allacma fusca TaxID=39272 RepID=A0A8J2JNV0_9HEXA|nr:unnamed protein product [Allacma fusca]
MKRLATEACRWCLVRQRYKKRIRISGSVLGQNVEALLEGGLAEKDDHFVARSRLARVKGGVGHVGQNAITHRAKPFFRKWNESSSALSTGSLNISSAVSGDEEGSNVQLGEDS